MKSTYLYSLLLLFAFLSHGCDKSSDGKRVTEDNLRYVIVDGEAVVVGYQKPPTGDLVIPETITKNNYPVTYIEESVFDNLDITSLTMPSIKLIGRYAFSYCELLQTVTMPKVEIINEGAFRSCSSLISLDLPVVTSINSVAFSNDTTLVSIYMPSIKTIGSQAFYCRNLTSVNMPQTGCCFDDDTYSSSFYKCPWQPSDDGVTSSCP